MGTDCLLARSDARRIPLPDRSVHCVVTSPPYWGLRDYGVDGQLGLEQTPQSYVDRMVEVFREVRRVLRDDGTLWLNLGDSYGGDRGNKTPAPDTKHRTLAAGSVHGHARVFDFRKQLIGIPWRVAFALQASGWYLRSEVIWCLSGGTWLYARTKKGEMPVMLKDLVRLDPSTVQLWNGERWTQVLGWNRSVDQAVRLELVLRSGERIGCTGGHQWPTARGLVRASDLRAGDVIRTCDLPSPPGAGRPSYLQGQALWFLGIYLAEGSKSGDKIAIAANADEMHWVEAIREIAEWYGGTVTHTIDGNSLSIRVYSRILAAIIDTYIGGNTAIDKHLKVAAWRLASHELRRIAEGYLEGGGHADPGNDRVRLGFCRNYSLERDLRTLAARTGATLTLKPVVAQYQSGSRPAFRGEWRWQRSGHHNERNRGEIVEIRQSRARQFWDIGVADEPHLFALASGVLTHNSKPNPMPESVNDRPTKSHEQVFLLTKSPRYFYDKDAVAEEAVRAGDIPGGGRPATNAAEPRAAFYRPENGRKPAADTKNLRTVWRIATTPYPGAHFATMPPELARRCVKAGCPAGGLVFDPFNGAGTTGMVATQEGRRYVGFDLSPDYLDQARRRIADGLRPVSKLDATAYEPLPGQLNLF